MDQRERVAKAIYDTGLIGYEPGCHEYLTIADAAIAAVDAWQPIETAPFAVWGLVWHRGWRRPFPGMRNGYNGAIWVDTCETAAAGRQDYATHWRPNEPPSEVA
jgi:hypothetical protein